MKKFLQGIIFITLIVPIINNLVSLFNQITNHICTWIAAKTYSIKKNLDSEEESSTNVIGFQVPNYSEDDYDEEGE